MSTKKILEEALSLPIEERALIADSLLRSLNTPTPGTEAKWVDVAKRRLQEIRSGRVQSVPGEDVFERALERFSR